MTPTITPLRLSRIPVSLLLVALAALCLHAAGALAQTEARVYQLQHRAGDEVAAQISELYQGASVTVTARAQQLVLRGDTQLLDEIGQLIETIDVAPVQLRITVRSQQEIGGKRTGGGVSATNDRVGVSVERKVISTGQTRERTLVVQDGQSAHVTSGQIRTLPVAVRAGKNPAAVLQQVETRSGFLVSARAISEQAIELEIVSFEEDPAALAGYETEAVVTLRRVEPGQWVTLGSITSQASSRQTGITYGINSNRTENRRVEVRVDILP